MKCHICGGTMQQKQTDMPFKLDESRIVIIRQLPVSECTQCGETLIADDVMAQLELLLAGVDEAAELEVKRYVPGTHTDHQRQHQVSASG